MSPNAELDKYRPKVNPYEIIALITRHPGLTVFLIYATIAIAGFVYLLTFYSYFNLPITTYLEVSDILVAGIKDPMVMLMVFGAFSVVFITWAVTYIHAPVSAWLDKKFNHGALRVIPFLAGVQSARSFWWGALAILLVYFVIFISMHSKNKAELIIDKKYGLVTLDSKAISNPDHEYSLLSTSINYIFLYDHQTKNTLVLPLNNINSITPKRPTVEEATPVPSLENTTPN
ncbi:hypothetical protein [Paraglaciecola marina]|uniref:hypothetical protein n=1 Tax=Paraglaciecola marina TaxID=2500157 RepID=UPI00105F41D6|nr:hypothetical protein [Paraglaciecola marina]